MELFVFLKDLKDCWSNAIRNYTEYGRKKRAWFYRFFMFMCQKKYSAYLICILYFCYPKQDIKVGVAWVYVLLYFHQKLGRSGPPLPHPTWGPEKEPDNLGTISYILALNTRWNQENLDAEDKQIWVLFKGSNYLICLMVIVAV